MIGEGERWMPCLEIDPGDNPRLQALVPMLETDEELWQWWHSANVTSARTEVNDHGPTHVQLVARTALRLLALLQEAGVKPSVVRDYLGDPEDAGVVVVMGALLHDVGMAISRDHHERYSLILADRKLPMLLSPLYPSIAKRTWMITEILHAMIAHKYDERCLTIEAGVVRVADALDMSEGRSRIPFERGSVSIHAVSAMAIDYVDISPGADRPIHVEIGMRNPAGVFQIDELLKRKLHGSGIEQYVEVIATLEDGQGRTVHPRVA